MKEPWKDQATELSEVFALENKPIAVTFTNDPADATHTKPVWICRALRLAGTGRSFVLETATSACPGGSWHCGLTAPPAQEARRALQQFLTRGEKLTHSIVSFHRMMYLGSQPPTGLSDRIVIGPMEHAPMRPDIAVFICSAEQACRLITLDHHWDGKPLSVEMTGSMCHSAIAYPIVTGNTNVTFGDWTARRMQKYQPGDVLVSVPYERMANLVAAIPESSSGTAEVELPEGFRQVMEADD